MTAAPPANPGTPPPGPPPAPHRGGGVAAPELCRITVLARNTQLDLALPLGVPIALLLPAVVDLISSHRPRNDFEADVEQVSPDSWTLARIGHEPLSPALGLDEHGVRDGEILVLENLDRPAPTPLFDDVMYNVAVADRETLHRWTPRAAAMIGSVVALVAMTVASVALLVTGPADQRLAGGIALLAVASVLVAVATFAHRVGHDHDTGMLTGAAAIPAGVAGGILVVPGDPGVAHLMTGAAVAILVAVSVLRIAMVGTAAFTAVTAAATIATVVCGVGAFADAPTSSLGAAVVLAGLLLVAAAPRLAMQLAALPLPPVPTPGTSLDPTVSDPDDDVPMPSFDELETRSARARSYLTGLLFAGAATTAVGAWFATRLWMPDTLYPPGLLLAAAAAAVLLFRGRTYVGVHHAAPLVVGGASIVLALPIGAIVADAAPPGVIFAAGVVVFAGAVAIGVYAPRHRFTPVQRRAAEWAEYACIATVVPLAVWVVGLFALVRGL